MSVAQATCSRMKREKVVALQALDWQSVWYWQQSIDSQGGGLNHFNLAEVSLVWLPWPLGTAPPYPTAWRHVDHGLLWWHTFSQTQEGIMSPCGRAGVPRCMGRWPRFRLVKQSRLWWNLVICVKTSPDYTMADMWETLALPLQQQSATTALPETAWTRGVEERRQYFWWNARGICSREAAGLLQWAFSKKVCKKDESFEKKQRPRGSWMRPWPKNGPLGRSRRIALGSANRSFNRYSMRIPTLFCPQACIFSENVRKKCLGPDWWCEAAFDMHLSWGLTARYGRQDHQTQPFSLSHPGYDLWFFRCQKIKSTSMQACYR